MHEKRIGENKAFASHLHLTPPGFLVLSVILQLSDIAGQNSIIPIKFLLITNNICSHIKMMQNT